MSSYCLKYEENTKSIILQASRTVNSGVIVLSKYAVCAEKIKIY